MRLTLFTDYSMRVLLFLAARPDRLTTIPELSEHYEISQAHLMKITHTLGKTGWVETVRGRNGGMRLIADPTTLRLDEVIGVLESDFALAECFTDGAACKLTGQCGLAGALHQATNAFLKTLSQHTLASLSRTTRMEGTGAETGWNTVTVTRKRVKTS